MYRAQARRLCILERASDSGAESRLGCKMPFTAFRLPFREYVGYVDERRFGRLVCLLEDIQVEVVREATHLHPLGKTMTDCAAFSLQAMENGENLERMSARIDTLTRSVMLNRRRQVSLEQQMSFLAKTRAELQCILVPL